MDSFGNYIHVFMLQLCVPLSENNIIASCSHSMYPFELHNLRVLWLKAVQTQISSFKFLYSIILLCVPTQYMLLHTVFLSVSIHSLLSPPLCVSFNISAINISYCYSLTLSVGLSSWICLSWPLLWLCLWWSLQKKPSLISPRFLSSHVKSCSLCCWHSIYYFKVRGNAIINHR